MEAKSTDGLTAMSMEIQECRTRCSLLHRGADTESRGDYRRTHLQFAVRRCDKTAVQQLVSRGANIDAIPGDERTPLMMAVRSGCTEVVQTLLDAGTDMGPTVDDDTAPTPLACALYESQEDAVKLRLERRADCCATPSTIHEMMLTGPRHIVGLLLDDGNAVVPRAVTDNDVPVLHTLHTAVQSVNEEVVELLLDRGADPESRTDEGWTPLMKAVAEAYPFIFTADGGVGGLIEAHASMSCRFEPVARTLVEAGADPVCRTDAGQTPLIAAAALGGHAGMLNLLFRSGAGLEDKDQQGQTAFSWATKNGH